MSLQQCEMVAGSGKFLSAGELVTGPAGVSLRNTRVVRNIVVPAGASR